MLTITSLEKDRNAKAEEGLALIEKYGTLAESENRVMTAEELAEIEAVSKQGTEIQAKIDRLKGVDAMKERIQAMVSVGSGQTPAAARSARRTSMGSQFVESDEYRSFFGKGLHRTSAAWRSPSIELVDYAGLHAATLTTDPASGGDLITPDYRPGVLPLLFKPLRVADLLASGTTDSNAIQYMVETVFTNAAAAVAEGAAKPESTLIFDAITDLVRKLAHWLPVTEEMLEDVSQIRSYIDARLRLGVEIAEENQLLNGDGIAPNLLGLMNRPGLHAAFARVDPMTNAEAIFVQMQAIYWASFIMPTGTIMNPVNWAATALMKTTTGEYMGGGPFSGPVAPTLWGVPVAVSPSIVANTALTGAFKSAAQVFRKGGIRVEASNSHQDFFIKNLVAIRAEERLALAVYRPGAFGKVTGLTGQALPLAADEGSPQGRLAAGGEEVEQPAGTRAKAERR
jgi:HK97 family phage major capsid protein